MKYLYLLVTGVFLSSCAIKVETPPIQTLLKKPHKVTPAKEYIEDLQSIPQDITYYTEGMKASKPFSQEEYEKKYFHVWNIAKSEITLQDAMWAHKSYNIGNSYGENLQHIEQDFFDTVLDNSNYGEFKTLNKKAVTLRKLNIRAMPSNRPVLLDPKKAGEGFPFDYLQNSTISPNKPILLSHYSKDKKWAFIESSFAYGWVESRDIITLDEKHIELWQQAEQVFIIKEGSPIYSDKGEFLFYSTVGMMLALIDEDQSDYTVLTVKRYKNQKAYFSKSKISKDISKKGILEFSSKNIATIIEEISKSNYGWGGMYGQRDCSSTLRDFYAPFGLWLPRNSYQQSISGEVIVLDKLNEKEKEEKIKQEAIVFKTLLYKRGHIGLYVGNYNNRPIIYQNVWGVKTQKDNKEGRFIIGKPIFSTLEVGSNLRNYDKNASMLHKLKSFTKL